MDLQFGPLTTWELFGGVVTAGAAYFAYIRSEPSGRKQNVLICGVLGAIVTMMVSLRFDLVPSINAQLSLTQEIRKSPRMLDLLASLSKLSVVADNDKEHELLKYMAGLHVDRFEREVKRLAEGSFSVSPGDMQDFALKLARQANVSIQATSLIRQDEWWRTSWGAAYQQANLQQAARGVEVTRVFIFDSKDELDSASELLRDQYEGGIRIFYAFADEIEVAVSEDMVVVDGMLAGRLELTPDKRMKRALFFTDRTQVTEISRKIEVLLDQSRQYLPSSGEVDQE